MYLLNLVILLLILINLGVCSYGLYKKVNEKYMNGDDYGKELLNKFKESQDEGYSDLDEERLSSKFDSEGEGYEDSREAVQANLSDLYGE